MTALNVSFKKEAIEILQRHFGSVLSTPKEDGTFEVEVFEKNRRVTDWVVTILKEKGFTMATRIKRAFNSYAHASAPRP